MLQRKAALGDRRPASSSKQSWDVCTFASDDVMCVFLIATGNETIAIRREKAENGAATGRGTIEVGFRNETSAVLQFEAMGNTSEGMLYHFYDGTARVGEERGDFHYRIAAVFQPQYRHYAKNKLSSALLNWLKEKLQQPLP